LPFAPTASGLKERGADRVHERGIVQDNGYVFAGALSGPFPSRAQFWPSVSITEMDAIIGCMLGAISFRRHEGQFGVQ
jgi:hypothetical protein